MVAIGALLGAVTATTLGLVTGVAKLDNGQAPAPRPAARQSAPASQPASRNTRGRFQSRTS
jgi:hypothetical protein